MTIVRSMSCNAREAVVTSSRVLWSARATVAMLSVQLYRLREIRIVLCSTWCAWRARVIVAMSIRSSHGARATGVVVSIALYMLHATVAALSTSYDNCV